MNIVTLGLGGPLLVTLGFGVSVSLTGVTVCAHDTAYSAVIEHTTQRAHISDTAYSAALTDFSRKC